jgi:HlyD family secretion protein
VRVIEARLARARAELERHRVRAPFDGQVIRIHARQGERVGDEGILEFGRTEAMVAIAEVYETDIDRVAIGQQAVVASPALAQPLTGHVDRIWHEVGKQDVLGTDPAARQDARVVEVQIRLDESEAAARMSNLQVTVEIETGAESAVETARKTAPPNAAETDTTAAAGTGNATDLARGAAR